MSIERSPGWRFTTRRHKDAAEASWQLENMTIRIFPANKLKIYTFVSARFLIWFFFLIKSRCHLRCSNIVYSFENAKVGLVCHPDLSSLDKSSILLLFEQSILFPVYLKFSMIFAFSLCHRMLYKAPRRKLGWRFTAGASRRAGIFPHWKSNDS